MFKELKVIKLLVILGLLITLLYSIKPEKLAGLYIITNKSSYENGDTLRLFFKTGVSIDYAGEISIKNIVTDKVVSELIVDFKNQGITESNIIEKGFSQGYSMEIIIDDKFVPGIYSVGNVTTFIVSNPNKSDITIVYPYISSLLLESYESENALNSEVSSISQFRSISIDKFTDNWLPFFKWLEDNYQVNYITDLQLENLSNYKRSKCLFVYGYSAFWTKKMKSSFLSYYDNGADVLVASTYLMNNVIWNDEKNNRLLFNEDGTQNGFTSWRAADGSPILEEVGMSYALGSKGFRTSRFAIKNQNHALFSNVSDSIVELSLAEFTGYPLTESNSYCEEFVFFNAELIATSAIDSLNDRALGILELKKDSLSGTIISLGSGEWAEQEAFENKGSLFQIAQNAAAYLIQL